VCLLRGRTGSLNIIQVILICRRVKGEIRYKILTSSSKFTRVITRLHVSLQVYTCHYNKRTRLEIRIEIKLRKFKAVLPHRFDSKARCMLVNLRNIFIYFSFIFILYYKQQKHNYIITVYITTVSLCNLHCYMFRHCHVIIRQFTTNALLSNTRSSN
jgi:hypothetical protein